MVALYVETLLMLAAVYFVGAAVACLIRRGISMERGRAVPAERRVDPLPEALQPATGARFGRPAHHAEPAPPPAPARPAPAVARPAPAAVAAEPPQDLKRIALIDAALEAELNKSGVGRYDQIAAWLKPDVKRFSDLLGVGDRISRENWIEQAQVLAKGGETQYSRRRARGEAAVASPTPDEGERRAVASAAAEAAQAASSPRPASRGVAATAAAIATSAIAPAPSMPASPASPQPPPVATTPANVAERAAFAIERRPEPPAQAAGVSGEPAAGAMPAAPPPAVPIRPTPPAARDDLRRISHIDAGAEQLLAAEGVTRYSDIAQWSPADVTRFDRLVGGGSRVQRENWVEQAQILSRGGDTAFSRGYDRGSGNGAALPPQAASAPAESTMESAAAPPPKPDLSALRSLRGQDRGEEPGPEAALAAASQDKVIRAPTGNDLKRIRGIGVLIEKKLNSMGVASYEQIANWTAQDIDRVSQQLDFKGRIERENWVEQARILASGGATEFSRRFDSGELETSRYKT
jgi:predicted flap endonuclease-1-like 5' DNA nuclease